MFLCSNLAELCFLPASPENTLVHGNISIFRVYLTRIIHEQKLELFRLKFGKQISREAHAIFIESFRIKN